MQAKSVLNRAFTTREKILVLILAVLVVIAVYYFAVVQNVSSTIEANNAALDDIETEITTQQTIALQRNKLEAALEQLGDTAKLPEVAVYDNIRAEFDEVEALMAKAETFNVSFGNPTVTGTSVRRTVTVTYTMDTYADAAAVVTALSNGDYYCIVDSFSFATKKTTSGSAISATLHATFFETTLGAKTTAGLTEKKSS